MQRTQDDYHSYADDTQNYHSFVPNVPGDQQKCITILESCVSDIRIWMCINQLKLNDDKTKFILIGTRQQLAKISRNIAIRVSPDLIPATETAKNLGYHLDSTLKNITHINKLCSSLPLTIRRICKIRPNINEEMTRTLVQPLITTRLDYCNSLLIGTSDYILYKLQCIQNSAARLVFNKKWVYHITPCLESLHWLKIKYRIGYKICMLMFKCVKELAPGYLCELVISNHNRNLRSSTANLLPVSKHKLSQVHNSSFKSVRPRL